MRVRQADIARAVGVSQPAVSVVLRGRGDQSGIPAETQQRVWEVARRLGYAPNPVAQNLQGSRTRLIGVHSFEAVFPFDHRDYYYEFLLGVEEQAEVEGYDLVLFTSTAGTADRRRQLFRDGVNRLRIADGSILLGRSPDRAELARLANEHYPFVHIGRRDVPGQSIPNVSCDYADATELATAKLIELGHRHLCYLGTREPFEPQYDRRAGFDRARERIATVVAERLECSLPELSSSWLERMLADGVTALIVESNAYAIALRDLFENVDLTVPDQLSVVVLDQGSDPKTVLTDWSTVTIPRAQMGREAVRLLIRGLEPDKPEPVWPVLPCGRAGNESIAPPPER